MDHRLHQDQTLKPSGVGSESSSFQAAIMPLKRVSAPQQPHPGSAPNR